MSREVFERNGQKSHLLYPANLLTACPNIFSIILRFWYSSESYLAGEILLHFGGIHVFRPYMDSFAGSCPYHTPLSAKAGYFIRKLIPFGNFLYRFFGVASLVRLSRHKNQVAFFLWCDHVLAIFGSRSLPRSCQPACVHHRNMLSGRFYFTVMLASESIMALLLFTCFCSKRCKGTSPKKPPLLLPTRAKRFWSFVCGCVEFFHTFSVISLLIVRVLLVGTGLVRVFSYPVGTAYDYARANFFSVSGGDWQKFFRPVKCLFEEIGGYFHSISS